MILFLLQEKQTQPHYLVLPDKSEHHEVKMYVSQDDIKVVTSKKVPFFCHKIMINFFSKANVHHYIFGLECFILNICR